MITLQASAQDQAPFPERSWKDNFETYEFLNAGSIATYQIQQGKFCAQVGKEDYYQMYPDPSYKAPECPPHESWFKRQAQGLENLGTLLKENRDYPEEISNAIFADAARKQVSNDQCMAAMIQRMQEFQPVTNYWKKAMFTSWVRMKRAELLLNKCNAMRAPIEQYLRRNEDVKIWEQYWGDSKNHRQEAGTKPLGGWKWEKLFKSHEEKDLYKELCLNNERYLALKGAQQFFMQTVPYVNSTSFMKVFDDHREKLILKSTNKPMTDQDLLSMDLRDSGALFKQFKFPSEDMSDSGNTGVFGENPDNPFDEGLNQGLEATKGERRSTVNALNSALNLNSENPELAGYTTDSQRGALLTRGQKEYLYLHGVVHEALEDKGQIDYTANNGKGNYTAAAVCTMSMYESSVKGMATDMVLSGLLGGSGWLRFRNFIAGVAPKQIPKWLLMTTPKWAKAEVGFLNLGGKLLTGSCMNQKSDRGLNAVQQSNATTELHVQADLLPNTLGPNHFENYDLSQKIDGVEDVPPDSPLHAPECKEKYAYLRSHMEQMSCANAMVINLPVMGGLIDLGTMMYKASVFSK